MRYCNIAITTDEALLFSHYYSKLQAVLNCATFCQGPVLFFHFCATTVPWETYSFFTSLLPFYISSLFCFSCTSFILHRPPLLSSFSMSSSSSFLHFLLFLYFLSFSFLMPLVLECFPLLLLLLFMGLSIIIVNHEICWQAGDPFGKFKIVHHHISFAEPF